MTTTIDQPRAALPSGDVPLADGRFLRALPDWSLGLPPGQRAWETLDGLRVIASLDRYLGDRHGPLLHVSASYPHRLPGWAELRLLKAAFYGPRRSAMVVLPRDEDYVNHHPFCHHLWDMPEPWTSR